MQSGHTSLLSAVEKIHAAPTMCCINTTGAGASAVAVLTSVAGCSKTLLDARVPYSMQATEGVLEDTPDKFLCADTGRMLAFAAFQSAKKLKGEDGLDNVVGIGATAAVQTDRTRRGEDVVYATCWGAETVIDYKCIMSKDMSRAEQEDVVCHVILGALAAAAGVPLDVAAMYPQLETATFSISSRREPLEALMAGDIDHVVFNAEGMARCDLPPYVAESRAGDATMHLVLPGSFNPLHYGHTELASAAVKVAKERYGKPCVVTFELAVSRVGKGVLTQNDISERVQQFAQGTRVAVTNARLFVEKARIFRHCGFVVGVDTAERLIDPAYYNNDRAQMLAALKDLHDGGCVFFVGGRRNDVTQEWEDLTTGAVVVPTELQDMFIHTPRCALAGSISSTLIRGGSP